MPMDSRDRRLHESWVLRKLILLVACILANMRTKCIVGRNSSSGSAMFHMSFYYLRFSMKASSYSYRKKSYGWTHDVPVQAKRGDRGVAPTYSHPRRWKWMSGQHHAPAALPPWKNRYTLYRRLDGPVWRSTENLSPIGIRTPNRPTRKLSLYRLRYPGLLFQRVQVLSGSGSHPAS